MKAKTVILCTALLLILCGFSTSNVSAIEIINPTIVNDNIGLGDNYENLVANSYDNITEDITYKEGTEAKKESETKKGSEAKKESETKKGTEAKKESETKKGSEAKKESETKKGSEAKKESETKKGTETKKGSETKKGGAETKKEPEYKNGTISKKGSGPTRAIRAKEELEYSYYSPVKPNSYKIWRLTAISGEAGLRGIYQESKTSIGDYSISQNNSNLIGLFMVKTRSFFVHPNFMKVMLNASYSPQARQNSYVGIPNYAEKTNLSGLDFSALFFGNKRLNLTTNATINNDITNVENITTVKTKNKQYGALLSYSNKFLPFSIGYTQQQTEQSTVGSNRKFAFDSKSIQGNVSKSFYTNDENSFSYTHTESSGRQYDSTGVIIQTVNSSNTYDNWELNNSLPFDKMNKYVFNSCVSNIDGRGTSDMKRFNAREGLTLKLPKNFIFSNAYTYAETQDDYNKINFQALQSSLSHQLFRSLNSRLSFDHTQTSQTYYKEQRDKIGVDLRYIKQIPKGKLTLAYSYYKELQQVLTPPTTLTTVREAYVINDNEIILLKRSNVTISSVIVQDVNGNILLLNVDYILVDKNPYLEIVRVPGSLYIPNGATVYISYTSSQAGLSNYEANIQSFSTELSLFKNFLNMYYMFSSQHFQNQKVSENLVLNYYTRNVIGARLDYHFVKAGAEYEVYASSILPYTREKYFVNLQKGYRKVIYSLNGNMQYFHLQSENSDRKDTDVSGKISYTVFRTVRLNWDLMYRNIRGAGINLDLTTSRLEITTNMNKLFFSLGLEVYLNKAVNNVTEFKGVYLQLKRSF